MFLALSLFVTATITVNFTSIFVYYGILHKTYFYY